MNKRDIIVTYDGEYPNTCRGNLIITVDAEEVYNKYYSCDSTGRCGWNDDHSDYISYKGKLKWEDEELFDTEIVKAVYDVLNEKEVCCGGCI